MQGGGREEAMRISRRLRAVAVAGDEDMEMLIAAIEERDTVIYIYIYVYT